MRSASKTRCSIVSTAVQTVSLKRLFLTRVCLSQFELKLPTLIPCQLLGTVSSFSSHSMRLFTLCTLRRQTATIWCSQQFNYQNNRPDWLGSRRPADPQQPRRRSCLRNVLSVRVGPRPSPRRKVQTDQKPRFVQKNHATLYSIGVISGYLKDMEEPLCQRHSCHWLHALKTPSLKVCLAGLAFFLLHFECG